MKSTAIPAKGYPIENLSGPHFRQSNPQSSKGFLHRPPQPPRPYTPFEANRQADYASALPPVETLVRNGLTFIRHEQQEPVLPKTSANEDDQSLFRLFVKNGEYIYAKPNDIVMIESCDHLVKVHLAIENTIKKAVRNNTLKDFLLQLPQDKFTRIGRFCAVNIARLSGGNCKEQTFEFDFKVSIKLKRAIPQSYFTAIGK